jgi:hypothetical protein
MPCDTGMLFRGRKCGQITFSCNSAGCDRSLIGHACVSESGTWVQYARHRIIERLSIVSSMALSSVAEFPI